jgi:hypothetical protein
VPGIAAFIFKDIEPQFSLALSELLKSWKFNKYVKLGRVILTQTCYASFASACLLAGVFPVILI